MNIRCVGQRIVVERLSPVERRGLILPPGVKDRSLVGRVLHKGPDADWVEEGDIVHFARYSGTLIKADDEFIDGRYEETLYMNCEDILGVLEGVKQGLAGSVIKEAPHPFPDTAQPSEEVAKV